jgi:hypothetical protein
VPGNAATFSRVRLGELWLAPALSDRTLKPFFFLLFLTESPEPAGALPNR